MSEGSNFRPDNDDISRRLHELEQEIAGADRARQSAAGGRDANRDQAKPQPPPAKRGRGARAAGGLAVVVVLAGAALFGWHQLSRPEAGGPDDTKAVTNGAVPATSASSATAPAASPSASVARVADGPPADPFAGTPADHWADGTAGVGTPAAAAHGPFSASQVAAAYATTRTVLIAQDLDHTTLLGGAPTAFADLLTTRQRAQFIAGLNKIGVDKQGYTLSTRTWVASFAPGTTRLVGAVIKVNGTMSARSAVDQGHAVLDVDVNYRFAYAVEPPHAPTDWMRIVGQETGDIEFTDGQDPGGPLQPYVAALPAEAGGRCGMTDGYIHPDYPSGPADKVQPSGAPINPYSLSTPNKGTTACRAATGT